MHLLIDRCGGKKILVVVIVIRYWIHFGCRLSEQIKSKHVVAT